MEEKEGKEVQFVFKLLIRCLYWILHLFVFSAVGILPHDLYMQVKSISRGFDTAEI